MYRGNVNFAEMGDMSPEILVLARSQDLIGWRNFMEGRISKYFYEIQSYYLADTQSYMNRQDRTKAFISKILQITHAQWIYRNMSLNDEEIGYLRHTKNEAMKFEVAEMTCMNPDELLEESRFLLKMDRIKNSKKSFAHHDINYWMGAMRAAKKAGK